MRLRSPAVAFVAVLVGAVAGLAVSAGPAAADDPPTFVRAWASSGPSGIVTDPAGNVFVVERANDRVQEFDPQGNALGARTGLDDPTALGIDGNDTLYVLDGGSVARFDAAGSSLGSWATGVNTPIDLAVDAAGNVFVLSLQPTGPNRLVTRFSSTGAVLASWGVRLETRAVAVVPDGSAVLTINRHIEAGNVLTEILRTNSSGGSPGDFNFSSQVGTPIGLSVGGDGAVYATDTSNRITRFTADGAQAAQWGGTGSDDGRFDVPTDVAAGLGGRLYVADQGNHRVQAFTRSAITTCRGNPVTVHLAEGDLPTEGDDVIAGTGGDDTIDGLGGDDTICALEGDDTVGGGADDDVLDSGPGADTTTGGDGLDHLFGGIGPDLLGGGAGADAFNAGPGRDQLFGGLGRDSLFAGYGNDALAGNGGVDLCAGGPGVDVANATCETKQEIP